MKTQFLLLAIVAHFIVSSAHSQQTITTSVMHNGIQRSYILYIPASYTGVENVPLLFNFHGYTSNATEQMFYGDFRPIADTAGFIIIHPEGTVDNNGNTHFNVGWGASTVNDVSFTSFLIDTIAAQYAIDLDRVYSTGMSNGGFMSFRLACELSDRIAAIGSVTGSIVPFTLDACNPSHSVPVLQIHGDSDGTVPYNGGLGWSEPITSLVNWWVIDNNCPPTPVFTAMPNISTTDGTTAERYAYENPNTCIEVIHYKILGGDHTWPGAAFNFPGTNYDINASKEVWDFLSKYDINGRIDCGTTGLETLQNTPKKVVKIVDLMGRETEFKPNTALIYLYDDGSTERVFKSND